MTPVMFWYRPPFANASKFLNLGPNCGSWAKDGVAFDASMECAVDHGGLCAAGEQDTGVGDVLHLESNGEKEDHRAILGQV
jgi:hypothetical protein